MINWVRVGELRSEIGEEDFTEVLEIFLEEVEGVISDLRSGLDDGQYQSVLHFLKGSFLNLGFQVLAEMCQSGEQISANGRPELVDLTEILGCYDASKAVFLAELRLNTAA